VAAVSPKLNTLTAPLEAASYDLVFTKDSNITLDPGTMAAFVQNFTQDVGLVVGVPVAVRPENLAGRIEAYLINGHARLLLAASVLGLGFGVGKTMLFRRSDLARAGGIEALSNTLSEDTAIAMELARQGLKTVFSHRTIAQETGARSFAEIYNRQLRWSVIRRKNERFTFPLEPLASPLPAAFAGALAAPSWRGRPGSASLRHCFYGSAPRLFLRSPRAGRCRPGRRWRFSAVKSWRSRRGCVPSPPMMSSGQKPVSTRARGHSMRREGSPRLKISVI